MKSKIYALFIALCFAGISQAQTITLLSNGFDNYNGLPQTVAPGWYYSKNDTATISKSFYNTAGFFGFSSPAYKFGFDSVTVISPSFNAPDSLNFWMKGNGTPKDSNIFEVYTSPDSLTWNLLISMDSISPTAATISLPIPSSAKHVKFFYRKLVSGYNVGLDDIAVLKNSGVGINENSSGTSLLVFPTPTTGEVTVMTAKAAKTEIEVYDLLGNRLADIPVTRTGDQKMTIQLNGHQPGLYFIRIKNENGVTTRRVTLL